MLKKTVALILITAMLCLPSLAGAFTIAWMSDTQHYSGVQSEIWPQMNQWILDNRERLDIRYVFHTGDLVNTSRSDKQWEYAESSMKILADGGMPFLAGAGNHDVGNRPNYTRYLDALGTMQPMHMEQEYAPTGSRFELFSADGREYIFLSIAFANKGPSQEECEWAREVLSRYSDRIAIILTHSYIKRSGEHTTQGRVIYKEIVEPCNNVLLVLCGHCRGMSERYEETDTDGDGETDRTVTALLSNYQDDARGGQGYMRFLLFRRDEICIYTYSPILESYEHGKDQTVHLIPLPKQEQNNG